MPRPFTHRLRPVTGETLAGYTRRVLAANFEAPNYPERIVAEDGVPLDTEDGIAAWTAHLTARTGRDLAGLAPDPARSPRHADGTSCAGCTDLLVVRSLCTDCAGGQHISLYPTFDTPVCLTHARWAGFVDQPAEQQPVGPSHLAASATFDTLVAEHRLDVRLYTMLLAACQTEDPELSEAAAFPAIVAVAEAITDLAAQRAWIDLELRFADAYTALQDQVAAAAGASRPGVARAVWLYARPEIAAWRHALLRGAPLEAPDPHAFRIRVARPAAIPPTARIDPFEHYLDASGDTLATAADFTTARFATRRVLPPEREVQLTCRRGHTFIGRRKRDRLPDGTVPEAFDGRCSQCDALDVTPGGNDLVTVAPELAAEFDLAANDGLLPAQIAAKSSARKVWWRCAKGHPYLATPANRVLEHMGCPVCLNRIVVPGINDFATLYPELLLEWPADAELDPTMIGANTNRRLTWLCVNGHRYDQNILRRIEGRDCPFCEMTKLTAAKASIAFTHPDIAAEFDREWAAEKGIHIEGITHGSHLHAKWICRRCGVPFAARVDQRTRQGNGCPTCVDRQVVRGLNDLQTRGPILTLEWDHEQNHIGPDETSSVTKLYFWICDRGHDTHVSFQTRQANGGCGLCLPKERRILYRTSSASVSQSEQATLSASRG